MTRPARILVSLLALFLFFPPTLVVAQSATAASAQLQTELQLERKILALDLVGYREIRGREQATRDQVAAAMQRLDEALAGDALALVTLETLFTDLATARAAASITADQMDWQLRQLQERMRRISFIEGEVSGRGTRETGLAGRWLLQVSPTSQTGTFVLQLSGTAISGTYTIGTGSGSVRGTLVGNQIALDLYDTAGNVANTYTGGFDPTSQRMAGTWIATELASGQPSRGAWAASRPGAVIEE